MLFFSFFYSLPPLSSPYTEESNAGSSEAIQWTAAYQPSSLPYPSMPATAAAPLELSDVSRVLVLSRVCVFLKVLIGLHLGKYNDLIKELVDAAKWLLGGEAGEGIASVIEEFMSTGGSKVVVEVLKAINSIGEKKGD